MYGATVPVAASSRRAWSAATMRGAACSLRRAESSLSIWRRPRRWPLCTHEHDLSAHASSPAVRRLTGLRCRRIQGPTPPAAGPTTARRRQIRVLMLPAASPSGRAPSHVDRHLLSLKFYRIHGKEGKDWQKEKKRNRWTRGRVILVFFHSFQPISYLP